MVKKKVAEKTAKARAQARAKAKAKIEKVKADPKSVAQGPKKQLTGFMNFVRTQGVVGLAVGLAIGTQAGATVKAIVEGFINPIVAFLVGNQEGLLAATWNVVGKNTETTNYWFTWGERTLVLGWGAVFSAMITLLAVAAVIYYVVKGLKLDKLDRKKDA